MINNIKNRIFSLTVTVFSLSISLHINAQASLSVQCEYPLKDETTGILKLGTQNGEIKTLELGSKYLVLPDEQHGKLKQQCQFGPETKFDSSIGIAPSIIAKDGGYFRDAYYPVVSESVIKKYDEYIKESNNDEVKRDPSNTLTIFFHGTGSNPADLHKKAEYSNYDQFDPNGGGELMAYLAKKLEYNYAEYGRDYISIDGVGSGNRHVTSLHDNFRGAESYGRITGELLGRGVSENVNHCLMHIRGLTKNPANMEFMTRSGKDLKKVGRVLLLGWSRGAVTAIQFAYELYKNKDLKDIEVYMFLADPVPGLGNRELGLWDGIDKLYPNVKLAMVHYARNEKSVGFSPILPEEADEKGRLTGKNLNREIMAWPGYHATLVGNINNSNTNINKKIDLDFRMVPRMIRALAQVFLVNFGAPLEKIEYTEGSETEDIRLKMLADFENTLKPRVLKKFNTFDSESYTLGRIQKGLRPFLTHDQSMWGSGRNESNISGFHFLKDREGGNRDGKQIFLNQLHRNLAKGHVKNHEDFFRLKYIDRDLNIKHGAE